MTFREANDLFQLFLVCAAFVENDFVFGGIDS